MKKFLSLVLALVMTMSLVTISAGATEYKDLTDKDDIQYEEAVAVLNRIGIITGYEDGSFQPTKELTRGAAAKIIVSLLIGPEAASALPNGSAPYPDVPAGSTFAGVISFCKTREIISGYGDGTFKPTNSLTGYAFAKMLLGALGYDSQYEGFTGTGWTMNVANIGNFAGLFNRINFDGAASVNREQACQLALNTLKATMVEYTGGMNINTASGDTLTVNPTRTYKTSNQEYATHISAERAGGPVSDTGSAVERQHYTVEFGEEHFKDLRMNDELAARDSFGRPSNQWSFKKVTIGTYPATPDFVYTTQVAHAISSTSEASKVRALGLNGYKIDGTATTGTQLFVNGYQADYNGTVSLASENIFSVDATLGNIADLTDNGTLVELYVSEREADLITTIVVVKTQLMEIKRITSDAVTLDAISPNNKTAKVDSGYNQAPIQIDSKLVKVEDDNSNFAALKEMKVGDLVAVVPVSTDNGNTEYEVAKAYAPEVVEGKLTRVNVYGNQTENRQAISAIVGGTEYKVALWNKDLVEITADKIKLTREDVKLYLDEYGNALRIKNVGDTSDFMIIKGIYNTLVDGRILKVVDGWDIKGSEVSLNVGTDNMSAFKAGDLVYYTNDGASSHADWKVSFTNTRLVDTTSSTYQIKASNVRIKTDITDLPGAEATPYITSKVKTIFVTFDGDEVDSIEVRDGLRDVSNADLKATWRGGKPAQVSVDPDDEEITAVVVKRESNDALSSNLLYIRDYDGSYEVTEGGKKIYGYRVAMMSADGLEESEYIYSDKNLKIGDFASYTLSSLEGYEPFYSLKKHDATRKTTSVNGATVYRIVNEDKSIVELTDLTNLNTNLTSDQTSLGVGDEANMVSMARAKWLDLTDRGINSVGDLKDVINDEHLYPVVRMIYNDNISNDGFRTVSLVVVTGATGTATPPVVAADDNTAWTAYLNGKVLKSGTAAEDFAVTVAEAEMKNLKVVPAANNPTATVDRETVEEPADGTKYTFNITAQDGTTTVAVGVTVNKDASPTPVVLSYWLYPVNTPGSTSVNLFIEKRENGQGKGWLSQDEIASLGLDADDFELDNSALSPAGEAHIAPVQTAKYEPFGLYSYNPAYHNNATDATTEGGPHPDWFAQNAGFIKLQFAKQNDEGAWVTLIDSTSSKLVMVGDLNAVKYDGTANTSFTVNAST